MASPLSAVHHMNVDQLAAIIKNRIDKVLIIDSRSFLEFNTCHILNAVNVCCSKIVKRRLQQDKMSVKDFLVHTCQIEADESYDTIVYDQGSVDALALSPDSFIHVLLKKLAEVFKSVSLLHGGFLEFQAFHPTLCEDKTRKYAPMTSLSQPCLPICNLGPTRILPFLYLGSQTDAMNKELLLDHNITYELNVSANCPKPDFIQDHQFMRISVNDNYSEKLLPHFQKAFNFLDKVQEANGCVLVHCLAGISRSPTVAIAYVMRHLHMTSDEAYRYVKSKRATISPNFNFLGQLLEYERQLQAENLLRNGSELATAPVFVNGHKRQCTDMRSSRKLTLDLPVTTQACGLQAGNSPLLQHPGDQSPTTAIAKLSFHTPEMEKESDFKSNLLSFDKGDLTKVMGMCKMQEQKCLQSRCVKTTQYTYMSSLKEESSVANRSLSSASFSSTCSFSSSSSISSSTSCAIKQTLTSKAPFLSELNVKPSTASTSHEHTPEQDAVVSQASILPLSPETTGSRPPLNSLHCTGNFLDGATVVAPSQSSASSSVPSQWSTLMESNQREYCRSDSNSTSGIGSELCSEVSDLDNVMEVQSLADSYDSENKSFEVPATLPCPKHEIIIDNENVVLRKPFMLHPVNASNERTSLTKGFHGNMMKPSRDSGNPLSPVENFPMEENASESAFHFWEKIGHTSNTKASHDSGILASPTWNSPNEGCSSKWLRENYSTNKATILRPEEAHTEKNAGKNVSRSTNVPIVGEFGLSDLCTSESSSLSATHDNAMEKCLKQKREVTLKRLFGDVDQSSSKKLFEMSGDACLGKKDDGLYRAQSCPGIVGRIHCATPPMDTPTLAAAAVLTSGPRLGKLNFTSVDRAVKFRNRYSCGSLDYGDLERIFCDSCPDFGHFGRCQSSSALAAIGDRAPLTPTHRTFSRNISIIQVS